MINKKNIWFLTLFSLIIVLSIYYVTMPSELLLTSSLEKEVEEEEVKEVVELEESTVLVSLRIEAEEEYLTEVESLKTILTSQTASIEEKNNAYEQIKNINSTKSEQQQIEKQIEELTGSPAFVKIDKNQIRVVVDKKEHDVKLANQIMRLVQSNYKNKIYITVKFQSTN